MTNTTYYNLNIVEGSDIVNPLTVDNPNYQIIDETMHDNAVSGVTLATEITNAAVHAITRENSECAVIRFIATSVWKAGDTITVDGVPVTALLPSGETLPNGAYVINANVLCILTGTNMTVFAERKKTDNANDIIYNDTNVGAELDKVNNDLNQFGNSVFLADGILNAWDEITIRGDRNLSEYRYIYIELQDSATTCLDAKMIPIQVYATKNVSCPYHFYKGSDLLGFACSPDNINTNKIRLRSNSETTRIRAYGII